MTVKLLVLDFNGVLDSNMVYVMPDGSEAVRCYRGDGVGIARLRALSIPTVVISQETAPVVGLRCAKLGIACHQGVADKLAQLTLVAAAYGVQLDEIAYVGNDVNDLACLTAVGFPFVVADAEPELHAALPLGPLSTNGYLTRRKGGEGAVREVCELIAKREARGRDLSRTVSNGGDGVVWSP